MMRPLYFIILISLPIYFGGPLSSADEAPSRPSVDDVGSGLLTKAQGMLQRINFYLVRGADKKEPKLVAKSIESYNCWIAAVRKKAYKGMVACEDAFERATAELQKKTGVKPVVTIEFYDTAKGGSLGDPAVTGATIRATILKDIGVRNRDVQIAFNNKALIRQYTYLPGAKITYERFFGPRDPKKKATATVHATAAKADPDVTEDSDFLAKNRLARTGNRPERAGSDFDQSTYPERFGIFDLADSGRAVAGSDGKRISTVYFDFDSATLSDKAKAILDKAIKVAKANPRKRVTVIGHTDTAGPASYNEGLSIRRAESVARYIALNSSGIDVDDLIGRGERDTAVPTGDDVPERRNRRTEIELR